MTFRLFLPAALILVSLVLQAPGAAQGRPGLQDLVPLRTLLFFETGDVGRLAAALSRRSPLAALVRNREVRAFLDSLGEVVTRAQQDVGPYLGARPVDLPGALDGQAAFAVLDLRGRAGPPWAEVVVALGLEPGNPVPRMVFDQVMKYAREIGDVGVKTEQVDGFDVTVFDLDAGFVVYACFARDTLFLSSSDTAMELLLFRLGAGEDGADTLARSERYRQAASSANAAGAHTFCYIDFEAVWRALDRVFGGVSERWFPGYDLVMEGLDLRKLRCAGISLTVEEAGFRERLYLEGKGKALSLLLGKPGLQGPRRVDTDALFYFGRVMNWKALHVWTASVLEKISRRLECKAAADARSNLRLVEECAYGFGLGKDFLRALGREATLAVLLPAGSVFPRFTALIEVKDGDALSGILQKLVERFPGDRVKPRAEPYRGHGLAVFRIPGAPVTPTLTVAGDQLVIGSSVNVVKRWIRSKRETLIQSSRFKEALSRIGIRDLSEAYSVLYLDVPRLLAYGYDNFLPMAEHWIPDEIPLVLYNVKLDAARLPSTRAVTGPFRPMIAVTRPLGDGLVMDCFAPLPYLGTALVFLESLASTGITGNPLPPGELGVRVDDGYTGKGCRIALVEAGAAAARAGLEAGDVIVAMNGKAVMDSDAALAVIGPMHAGEILRLRLKREGKGVFTVEVVLQPKDIK